MTKAEFERHHVLFQPDDKATYIGKLVAVAQEQATAASG